jgi:hypothetical protein
VDTNYLSLRALQQADNVRTLLQRTMERFEVKLLSLQDEQKLFVKICQALEDFSCMQVTHKGEKGNYLGVKDHRRRPASLLRLGYPAKMGHFNRVYFDYSSVHSNGV